MSYRDDAGPRLIVSDDGLLVACLEGARVSLLDRAALTPRSELEVSSSGRVDAGFVGDQLLILRERDDGKGVLEVVRPLDGARSIQLELERPLRLGAISARHALLFGEQQSCIADLSGGSAVLHPLPLRRPPSCVAPLRGGHFLVAAGGGLDEWDGRTRRVVARFPLETASTVRHAGIAGRLLWVITGGATPQLQTFRVGGGKPGFRRELPALATLAAWHSSLGCVVVGLGDPGQCSLFALSLSDGEVVRLPYRQGPMSSLGVVPVDGEYQALVAVRGAPIGRVTLAAELCEMPEAGLGPSEAELDDAESAPESAEPAPAAPVADSVADRLREWREQVRRPRPAPAARQRPSSSDSSEWRHALCAWVRATLGTREPVELPFWTGATRLAQATERLGLEEDSARALSLLYGARLIGVPGVAAVDLARVIGERGWREALGHGALGELDLMRERRHLFRLRGALTRYLDERPPAHLTLSLAGGSARGPAGTWLCDWPAGLDASALAQQLTHEVGPIGVVDLRPARRPAALRSGLLEARLHGVTPLLLPGPETARPELQQPCALVAFAGEPSPAFADLPRLLLHG